MLESIGIYCIKYISLNSAMVRSKLAQFATRYRLPCQGCLERQSQQTRLSTQQHDIRTYVQYNVLLALYIIMFLLML